MRRPRVALGEGGARLGSDRVRGAVLDGVGAGLLGGAMAVDLATRPLAPGQSAATVVAYLLAGAICGPFAVHRRFPVAAILVSDLALILLTDRERDVLSLVAKGLSNAEIGSRLYVSPATVKTHVARILTKLGARDRAQLIVIAYESRLVRPGQA